jgi:iron complex transport system ATP-binding protein
VAADHPAQLVYDIRNLSVSLGGKPVLGPLDLQIPRGAFLGVLGPNGSGKTTLLRALAGVAKPTTGEISFWDRPIREYHSTEMARLVGVVPQEFSLEFGFTVAEMVAMGRYAHGGRRGRGSGEIAHDELSPDERLVADAMAQTGVSELADRLVTELSGGERQRLDRPDFGSGRPSYCSTSR